MSWYLYAGFIVSIYGFAYISDWIESYKEPSGLVVNVNGEIPDKKNQLKALRQGARFWEHQLLEVEKEIKRPESLISLRDEKILWKIKINEMTGEMRKDQEKMYEKIYKTPGMEKFELSRNMELEAKKFVLLAEEARENAYWEMAYEASLKRKPELLKLKEIIQNKLTKVDR
jgi:hypothetical protein